MVRYIVLVSTIAFIFNLVPLFIISVFNFPSPSYISFLAIKATRRPKRETDKMVLFVQICIGRKAKNCA